MSRQSKTLLQAIYDKLVADPTLGAYVKRWYIGRYAAVSQFPFVAVLETNGPTIDPETIGSAGHDAYIYNYTIDAGIKNISDDMAFLGDGSTPGILDLKDDIVSVLWCERLDRKFYQPLRIVSCDLGASEGSPYIYVASIAIEGIVRVQRTSCG